MKSIITITILLAWFLCGIVLGFQEPVEKPRTLATIYQKEYETIMDAAKANNCTDPVLLCVIP